MAVSSPYVVFRAVDLGWPVPPSRRRAANTPSQPVLRLSPPRTTRQRPTPHPSPRLSPERQSESPSPAKARHRDARLVQGELFD